MSHVNISFELDLYEDQETISSLLNAGKNYSALFEIAEMVRRRLRKGSEDPTKEDEAIFNQIMEICEELI